VVGRHEHSKMKFSISTVENSSEHRSIISMAENPTKSSCEVDGCSLSQKEARFAKGGRSDYDTRRGMKSASWIPWAVVCFKDFPPSCVRGCPALTFARRLTSHEMPLPRGELARCNLTSQPLLRTTDVTLRASFLNSRLAHQRRRARKALSHCRWHLDCSWNRRLVWFQKLRSLVAHDRWLDFKESFELPPRARNRIRRNHTIRDKSRFRHPQPRHLSALPALLPLGRSARGQ